MKLKSEIMAINERLKALRAVMERESLDAYIVSGTDPHNSEYLPDTWKQREWISGFTGSFGTVVVLKDCAGLWTDTRYFIQAEKQLSGCDIELHKLRIPGAIDYPEWLSVQLKHGSRVGLDEFCISSNEMRVLKEKLEDKGVKVILTSDLIGDVWLDRPALPNAPVFVVPDEVCGMSIHDKVQLVRDVLNEKQVDFFLFSALDEIAWLYNIRCSDISFNPVAISYALVGKEKSYFFIKQSKVSAEVVKELQKNGIEIQDYHHLFLFLDNLNKESRFCVDGDSLNYAVYRKITSGFSTIESISPLILAKSIKNQQEIRGTRDACLKDGVAMTKFLYWLESNISNNITECMASDRLTAFRKENQGYVSNSFNNISAYGANAASPHYAATSESDTLLQPRGLYLVDSGGQYVHGTTDITRTVPLGELTFQEKEDYTIVLKGMIALSCLNFPKGTCGCNIDVVARQPLWLKCRNYGHGTGHGIGFFLNVHEGPQSIRQDLKNQPLIPGMVTSNEPALYRENAYGIRHENMILCVSISKNEFGEWYGFETLTLCYFDTSAILTDQLNNEERLWINEYHQKVYESISPFLTSEEAMWLKEKTQPIV